MREKINIPTVDAFITRRTNKHRKSGQIRQNQQAKKDP